MGIIADSGLPVKPALGIVRRYWKGGMWSAGWADWLSQRHRATS